MLKIHQLFLISFGLIFLIMFIGFSSITYHNQKEIKYITTKERLISTAKLIETLIKYDSLTRSAVKEISEKNSCYIGVLNEQFGKFFISDKDVINMDVFNGIKNTTSSGKIDIDLLDESEVMYYAVNYNTNNKIYKIAIAKDINSTNIKFQDLFRSLIIIFIICILISLLMAKILNIVIDKKINLISNYLKDISEKRYNQPINFSNIQEFSLLYAQLENMKNIIIKNEKVARKQSAKIKLKNKQLEGILNAISHEFKNPISIIQASIQTIVEDKNMPKEVELKFINKIMKNTNKIVTLIDKLKISMNEEGLSLTLTSFDLKKLSYEIGKELSEKYVGRNINVRGEENIISADKEMISQVIINLVENALKYSDDDIDILITKEGLFVSDKGIGISEENMKFITKKFYKVSKNNWNNSLGLGLYIVKFILKLHNFEMIIKSQQNIGSTFGFKTQNL